LRRIRLSRFSDAWIAHRGEKDGRVSYWLQPNKYHTDEFREKWDRIGRGDGPQLAALMLRHNVGVRVVDTLYLKKVDEDFFGDE
jgi:restriction endonuclease Mrr